MGKLRQGEAARAQGVGMGPRAVCPMGSVLQSSQLGTALLQGACGRSIPAPRRQLSEAIRCLMMQADTWWHLHWE